MRARDFHERENERERERERERESVETDRGDLWSDLDPFGDFVTSAGNFDKFLSHDSMSGSLNPSSFSLHLLCGTFFFPCLSCGQSCRLQRATLVAAPSKQPLSAMLAARLPNSVRLAPRPLSCRLEMYRSRTCNATLCRLKTGKRHPLADKGTCTTPHARSLCFVTRCLRQYRNASLAHSAHNDMCENPRCIF